jgi:hypothetical protein
VITWTELYLRISRTRRRKRNGCHPCPRIHEPRWSD